MPNELVTVASFRDIPSAGLAQSILESEGINCFLDNQFTVGVNWLYSTAVGGVKLKVNKGNAEKAIEILKNLNEPVGFSGQPEEGMLPDSACPNCGDTDIVAINYHRKSAALSLLSGLPLFTFRKRYRCKKCGHKFK